MGYQAVKLTELTPMNTIWICRMCGGALGITSLTVEPNNGPPIPPKDH